MNTYPSTISDESHQDLVDPGSANHEEGCDSHSSNTSYSEDTISEYDETESSDEEATGVVGYIGDIDSDQDCWTETDSEAEPADDNDKHNPPRPSAVRVVLSSVYPYGYTDNFDQDKSRWFSNQFGEKPTLPGIRQVLGDILDVPVAPKSAPQWEPVFSKKVDTDDEDSCASENKNDEDDEEDLAMFLRGLRLLQTPEPRSSITTVPGSSGRASISFLLN
ncbi:hypothetical protein ONZ45_g12551 [Pleurotus djamor]|nr:hypothetical protein ONZ45_g12551 [Pleurotus djamor]